MTTTEIFVTEDPGASLSSERTASPDGRSGMGPMSHLADEWATLLARRWENFDARMLGTTVGAVLSGIDLAVRLPDEAIAEVRAALDAYKVVFFRDQHLTPDQHLDFAQRFGELEVHPFFPTNEGRPELVRFDKGELSAGYENTWHHDVTWRECPSEATILRAVEVPEVGGDTLFADMCAAYDGAADAAAAVACPTTLVLGRLDRMTPRRAAQPIVEAMGHATVVELATAGHAPMMEDPDAVRSALLAHLFPG